jgi:hypothetical protein
MKPIQYILLIDVATLLLCLKLIFGRLSLFGKALVVQFFPNEYYAPPVFARWEKRYDIRFKLSLLYWCAISIATISFLTYILLFNPLQ